MKKPLSANWVLSGKDSAIPKLSLWRPFIDDLLEDNSAIDIKSENMKIDSSKYGIIYLTTPDRIAPLEGLPAEFTQVCLFGGFGEINYRDQIAKAKENRIDILLSDVIPHEIEQFLGKEDLGYLLDKSMFVPCGIPIEINKNSTDDKPIKFISYEHEEKRTDMRSIIRKLLSADENVDYLDLGKLNTIDWVEKCTPSQTCNLLLADTPFSTLNAFLAICCDKNGTRFKNFDKQGFLSPLRGLLQQSNEGFDWIDEIANNSQASLREEFTNILRGEHSDKAGNGNNPIELDSTQVVQVIDHFREKSKFPTNTHFGAFSENLRVIARCISANNDESHAYLRSPYSYLYKDIAGGGSFASYIYARKRILRENAESSDGMEYTPLDYRVSEANLRLVCKLPGLHSLFVSYKLLQDELEHYLQTANDIYRKTGPCALVNSIAAHIQFAVQYHYCSNLEVEMACKYLIDLPIESKTKASLLLGSGQIDQFSSFVETANLDQGERGVAGEASTYYLLQELDNKLSDITFISEITNKCRLEIQKERDDISTHNALAIANLLTQEAETEFDYLIDAEGGKYDFGYHPQVWNQLALLAIFRNANALANRFIHKQETKIRNHPLETILGLIANNLLLENFDEAERFAEFFSHHSSSNIWDTANQPYFVAFYLAVIFRFLDMADATKKAESLMEETKTGWQQTLQSILSSCSPSSRVGFNLANLGESLSAQLSFVEELTGVSGKGQERS